MDTKQRNRTTAALVAALVAVMMVTVGAVMASDSSNAEPVTDEEYHFYLYNSAGNGTDTSINGWYTGSGTTAIDAFYTTLSTTRMLPGGATSPLIPQTGYDGTAPVFFGAGKYFSDWVPGAWATDGTYYNPNMAIWNYNKVDGWHMGNTFGSDSDHIYLISYEKYIDARGTAATALGASITFPGNAAEFGLVYDGTTGGYADVDAAAAAYFPIAEAALYTGLDGSAYGLSYAAAGDTQGAGGFDMAMTMWAANIERDYSGVQAGYDASNAQYGYMQKAPVDRTAAPADMVFGDMTAPLGGYEPYATGSPVHAQNQAYSAGVGEQFTVKAILKGYSFYINYSYCIKYDTDVLHLDSVVDTALGAAGIMNSPPGPGYQCGLQMGYQGAATDSDGAVYTATFTVLADTPTTVGISAASLTVCEAVGALQELSTENVMPTVNGDAERFDIVGVNQPPTEDPYIELSSSSETVAVGNSVTLLATPHNFPTAPTIAWASDNIGVATVDGGVVTGVSAGTARITASVGAVSAECVVTVTSMPSVEVWSGDTFTIDGHSSPAKVKYDADAMEYVSVSSAAAGYTVMVDHISGEVYVMSDAVASGFPLVMPSGATPMDFQMTFRATDPAVTDPSVEVFYWNGTDWLFNGDDSRNVTVKVKYFLITPGMADGEAVVSFLNVADQAAGFELEFTYEGNAPTLEKLSGKGSFTFAVNDAAKKFSVVWSGEKGRNVDINGNVFRVAGCDSYSLAGYEIRDADGRHIYVKSFSTPAEAYESIGQPYDPGVTEYKLGDGDVDGDVDVFDLVLLMKYLAGNAYVSEQGLKNLDVYPDGEVNILDAMVLSRYLVSH